MYKYDVSKDMHKYDVSNDEILHKEPYTVSFYVHKGLILLSKSMHKL
jgi:hypothetical protein